MVMDRMSECPQSLAEDSLRAAGLMGNVASSCRRLGVGFGPTVVAVSGGPDNAALAPTLKKI